MSDVLKDWKLTAFHQKFTLPEALIFYIAQNPLSPKLYHKLIRCCKYFWLNNPLITLNDLFFYDDSWRTGTINGFDNRQKFQIEHLNENLWICELLSIRDDRNQLMASSIIPRIYRCDFTGISFSQQTLLFDEFKKFTTSGFVDLFFNKTLVKNDDGSIVPIENLIELMPNLEYFHYENVTTDDGLQTITRETAAKLNAIPHFPKIYLFIMEKIPESFDIDAFFAIPKVSVLNCFARIFSYNFN